MYSLIPYLKKYRWRFVWGGLMLLGTNATALVMPQLFLYLVDGLNGDATTDELQSIAKTMLIFALCGAVFRVFSRISIFYSARDIELDLRVLYYKRLETQSPAFFADHPTGDLMSRATNDLSQVRLLFGPGILNVFNTVIVYVAAIPLMCQISVSLTLISMVAFPLGIYLTKRLAKNLYQANRDQQASMGALSTLIQETLAGIHVIRAFAMEGYQQQRFDTYNNKSYDASITLGWVRSYMWRLMTIIAGIGMLSCVYVGAIWVMKEDLTLGELVALLEYLGILAWPTLALGWVVSMWQRGAAAMNRLQEVMSITPEIASGDLSYDHLEPSVEARTLTVHYDSNSPPALSDVNFHIKPGATLGVVGGIGSGKSTLIKALTRQIDIPKNQLFMGAVDICALRLDSVRAMFSLVAQEPILFSKSVADNVAFGAPQSNRETILKFLTMASFGEVNEVLPKGIDTLVGERGVTLSGGQKQRIALARALLLAPPILILDDALSAVDTETEKSILGVLNEVRQGKTTIIISHRVSAVEHADEIILLDHGTISERGTHQSLISAAGSYAEMAEHQQLKQEFDKMRKGDEI